MAYYFLMTSIIWIAVMIVTAVRDTNNYEYSKNECIGFSLFYLCLCINFVILGSWMIWSNIEDDVGLAVFFAAVFIAGSFSVCVFYYQEYKLIVRQEYRTFIDRLS